MAVLGGVLLEAKYPNYLFFCSAAGALESPEGCAFDEEENASQMTVKHDLSRMSSAGDEENREPTRLTSVSHELSRNEVEKTVAKATITNNLSPSFHVDITSQGHTVTGNSGHKTIVKPQTVKVDEPEKAPPIVPNQELAAGNQPARSGFFSGKGVGDFSSQSISNSARSVANVEPLGKVPPTNSPSMWSSARSDARVDASKTSDGRPFQLLSDKVDSSDKNPLQSAGVVLRHAADLKDKAKPSVSFNSSGQTAWTAQGNNNSLAAYPGSQMPLVESIASGKSFQSEFKKEFSAASSPSGEPYSLQNASKQFGNVHAY